MIFWRKKSVVILECFRRIAGAEGIEMIFKEMQRTLLMIFASCLVGIDSGMLFVVGNKLNDVPNLAFQVYLPTLFLIGFVAGLVAFRFIKSAKILFRVTIPLVVVFVLLLLNR